MIICNSKKFIFIHVHKTGGSSFELGMEPYMAWNDLILGSTEHGERVNKYYNSRFKLGKHYSIRDVETACGIELVDSYVTCTMVRHPVNRAVSLFNFVGSIIQEWANKNSLSLADVRKGFRRHAKRFPVLEWPASRAFIESSDFSDFIRSPHLEKEIAFRPQLGRIQRADGSLVQHVWKLEEVRTWEPKVADLLGLGSAFALPRANESKATLIKSSDIPAKDRQFIEDLHQVDLKAFSY